MTPSGWSLVATQGPGKPDEALDQFTRAFMESELQELDVATRLETDADSMLARARSKLTAHGVAHPVALTWHRGGRLSHVGVALLVFESHDTPKRGDGRLASVLAQQLFEAGDARDCTVADLTAGCA